MSHPPTVLISRPEDAARRFAAALRDAGATAPVLIAPVLEIVPKTDALQGAAVDPGAARGVIFTSVHAVSAFVAQSDARPQAWCVGNATAAVARAAGFHTHSAAGHVDDLFRLIVGAGTSGPFLHPRGTTTRGALAERLSAAGLPTTEVEIYDQIARDIGPEARALLHGHAPLILPLFSPRSARLVAEAAQAGTAPLHLVAISRAAAEGWAAATPDKAKTLIIAAQPDAQAMREAVLMAIKAVGTT